MEAIRVVIQGASGKMGRQVISAVCREPGMQVVGAIELTPTTDQLKLPEDAGFVPISTDAASILKSCQPDVLVDFSIARATMPTVRVAIEHGVRPVIGTSGLSTVDLAEIDRLALAGNMGAVIAPNFALGAVLMIHMAEIAARYMDNAEIIELHHDGKVDAPSGTALATAGAMAAARGKPFLAPPQQQGDTASRGKQVSGIAVHSVRLPGLLAHQEVILGASGQTLTIRHDSVSRECFMPGVILAVREVMQRKGLVFGLDSLLGL
jgi:4-hydroxy-tetrahydrodipicolinate reductase